MNNFVQSKLIETSEFKFKSNSIENYELELPFTEHIEELRQRGFQFLGILTATVLIAFIDVKTIVKILETPVTDIHFFQLSPGEYFLSTVTQRGHG